MHHPLFGEIEAFRNEITSVVTEIRIVRGKLLINEQTRDRVRELSLTWNLNLRSKLAHFNNESALAITEILDEVARLASKRLKKEQFTKPLREAVNILDNLKIEIGMNIQKLFVDPPSTRKVLEEISDLPDHLIPKSLFGWKSELIRFLKKNPFDQNVFIMVRYGAESEKVLKWVKDAVESYPSEQKFSAIVAKDVDLIDDLNNPIACLLCCRYGIAIFDSVSTKAEINPNVAYEVGFMHLLQRKTLILKENKLTSLPSDILHKLYQPYSTEADVQKIVNEWLKKINPM